MSPRRRIAHPWLTAALATLLLVPASVQAAEGPAWSGFHPVRWTPARRLGPVAASAALRVAVDPETGTLGPLSATQAAELAALGASAARPAPLEPRQLPDGSWMVDLRGQFMSDVVVVKGSDGRLHALCTDQPQVRDRALAGATAAPAALPEE